MKHKSASHHRKHSSKQNHFTSSVKLGKYRVFGDSLAMMVWQGVHISNQVVQETDFTNGCDNCWHSQNIVMELKRSEGRVPRRIVLAIGYNESLDENFDPSKLITNIEFAIDMMFKRGCHRVVLMNIPPSMRAQRTVTRPYRPMAMSSHTEILWYWRNLEQINHQIKRIADQHENVYLCDVFNKICYPISGDRCDEYVIKNTIAYTVNADMFVCQMAHKGERNLITLSRKGKLALLEHVKNTLNDIEGIIRRVKEAKKKATLKNGANTSAAASTSITAELGDDDFQLISSDDDDDDDDDVVEIYSKSDDSRGNENHLNNDEVLLIDDDDDDDEQRKSSGSRCSSTGHSSFTLEKSPIQKRSRSHSNTRDVRNYDEIFFNDDGDIIEQRKSRSRSNSLDTLYSTMTISPKRGPSLTFSPNGRSSRSRTRRSPVRPSTPRRRSPPRRSGSRYRSPPRRSGSRHGSPPRRLESRNRSPPRRSRSRYRSPPRRSGSRHRSSFGRSTSRSRRKSPTLSLGNRSHYRRSRSRSRSQRRGSRRSRSPFRRSPLRRHSWRRSRSPCLRYQRSRSRSMSRPREIPYRSRPTSPNMNSPHHNIYTSPSSSGSHRITTQLSSHLPHSRQSSSPSSWSISSPPEERLHFTPTVGRLQSSSEVGKFLNELSPKPRHYCPSNSPLNTFNIVSPTETVECAIRGVSDNSFNLNKSDVEDEQAGTVLLMNGEEDDTDKIRGIPLNVCSFTCKCPGCIVNRDELAEGFKDIVFELFDEDERRIMEEEFANIS